MPRKKLTEEQRFSLARLNAMKHGFARRLPIIPDVEDEADWKRHLKGIRATFSPQGYFEELLVRRLATALWEIDRLTAYQVAATMANIKGGVRWMAVGSNYLSGAKGFVEPDPYEVGERIQGTLLPSDNDLELIMRYGGMLHRQWIQIHNQLITVQARRRNERAPVTMIDVMGPPPNLGPWSLSSRQAKDASPSPVAELVDAAEATITQDEGALAEPRRAARTEKHALERSEGAAHV